jgi:heptosyltransferase-2
MNGPLAIVQTAFPGDVVLSSSLVASMADGWPEVRPVMVVRPDTEDIAAMSGAEVLVWDKAGADRGGAGLRRVAERLGELGCRNALLPHRSLRSALMARSADLDHRVGFDLGAGALVYDEAVPYRRGVHEVERQHDLLARLARVTGNEVPRLRPPRLEPTGEHRSETAGLFAGHDHDSEHEHPFAALAPGSVWATKRWPGAYWTSLARALAEGGLGIVWLGGDADAALCGRLAADAGVGLVAAGRLSWGGTAALLDRARLLVTNDSAPVHVASAVGCPTVALFGPTVPGFGFGPLAPGSRSLGRALGCRPCRIHGSDACPEGHFRCMLDLTPTMVAESVADLIEEVYGDRGREPRTETVDAG